MPNARSDLGAESFERLWRIMLRAVLSLRAKEKVVIGWLALESADMLEREVLKAEIEFKQIIPREGRREEDDSIEEERPSQIGRSSTYTMLYQGSSLRPR